MNEVGKGKQPGGRLERFDGIARNEPELEAAETHALEHLLLLAELAAGKDLNLDGPARPCLDLLGKFLRRHLHLVFRRHDVTEFQDLRRQRPAARCRPAQRQAPAAVLVRKCQSLDSHLLLLDG